MTSSRLPVVLPAVLTFVFGATFGLVAGRILWVAAPAAQQAASGAQSPTASGGRAGMASRAQAGADPHDGMHDEAQVRAVLDAHAKLLSESPGDLRLTRTVANYHAMVGENEQALALYARARELAEEAGELEQVTDIMIDEGIALVESGDIRDGLKRLEDASARDATGVRSRLVRVAVYLERVMPQPPPGMDRVQALGSAETLLDEIDRLEPENAHAVQFRKLIAGVREMMGRPRQSAAAPAAVGAGTAPAGTAPAGTAPAVASEVITQP